MWSRMMGTAMAAVIISAGSAMSGPYSGGIDRARPDPSPRQDDEKTSRQRKQWLQKQARKINRKHR